MNDPRGPLVFAPSLLPMPCTVANPLEMVPRHILSNRQHSIRNPNTHGNLIRRFRAQVSGAHIPNPANCDQGQYRLRPSSPLTAGATIFADFRPRTYPSNRLAAVESSRLVTYVGRSSPMNSDEDRKWLRNITHGAATVSPNATATRWTHMNTCRTTLCLLVPHHRWAGPPRNQGATRRALPQKFFLGAPASLMSSKQFSPRARYPKLPSGP